MDTNFIIWLTGLPCSGKSTIAEYLKPKLTDLGCNVIILDGDVIRNKTLYKLGFSKLDRELNCLFIATIANILKDLQYV